MLIISQLKTANECMLKSLAQLHIRAFPNFFLTQLGESFLRLLYKGYLEDSNSGIIVAEYDGALVGFIAYSNDYSQFYKKLLNEHLIGFACFSLIAAIRHPSFVRRLFGAFRKSDAVKKDERYVELASICVDPNYEGHGIGSKLISFFIDFVDFDKYEFINLETDAVDNDKVNKFYLSNGFILERQFTTPEGRLMNEYRYIIGENR